MKLTNSIQRLKKSTVSWPVREIRKAIPHGQILTVCLSCFCQWLTESDSVRWIRTEIRNNVLGLRQWQCGTGDQASEGNTCNSSVILIAQSVCEQQCQWSTDEAHQLNEWQLSTVKVKVGMNSSDWWMKAKFNLSEYWGLVFKSSIQWNAMAVVKQSSLIVRGSIIIWQWLSLKSKTSRVNDWLLTDFIESIKRQSHSRQVRFKLFHSNCKYINSGNAISLS